MVAYGIGIAGEDRTTSRARELKVVGSEKERALEFHLLDFIRVWAMLLVSYSTLISPPCSLSSTPMLDEPNG